MTRDTFGGSLRQGFGDNRWQLRAKGPHPGACGLWQAVSSTEFFHEEPSETSKDVPAHVVVEAVDI